MQDKLANCSLVRVFSKMAEQKEFPLPWIRGSASRVEPDADVPQELRAVALHRLIRKSDRPFAALIAEYDRGFQRVRDYLEGRVSAREAYVMTAGVRMDTKVLSCLLYTSPSPRDLSTSRMPSSA